MQQREGLKPTLNSLRSIVSAALVEEPVAGCAAPSVGSGRSGVEPSCSDKAGAFAHGLRDAGHGTWFTALVFWPAPTHRPVADLRRMAFRLVARVQAQPHRRRP